MREFFDSVRNFIEKICVKIGGWVNLPPKTVGWIGLGVICVLIALCVFFIVRTVRKGKKDKKAEEPAPFAKPVTCTEPAVERARTVVATPVISETSTPVSITAAAEEQEAQTAVPVEDEGEQSAKDSVPETPAVEEFTPIVEEKPATVEENVDVKPQKPAKAKPTKPKKTDKGDASAKPAKKLNGKWTVEFKNDGEYMAKLAASNGEVMLSSEIYTTEEGARNGISTIIKGVDSGKFIIYQDKNDNYYYKLKTANNRLLCVGEIYKAKDQCLKAVETVKRIAKDSPVAPDLYSGAQYIDYVPAPVDAETKKGARGKWRIEKTESGAYSAKLYANNGQLMLATEEVSLRKSAENALTSVKKNSAEGNFIIDKDKFGRFYYKLRNAQKSVVCIGEAYDSLESCTSAIESVRRFAANATVVTEE